MRRSIATLATAAALTLVAGVLGLAVAPGAQAQTKPEPIVTGWFGWWAKDSQVSAVADQSDGMVEEVSMFWWAYNGPDQTLCTYDKIDLDRDGVGGECQMETSTPWTNSGFDRQRRILQDAGVRIQASITDLNKALKGETGLSTYLAQKGNPLRYAKKIARWAERAGVDGVDLDMENFAFNDDRSTWPTTRVAWISFVSNLGRELHDRGMTLSATVPGGWQVSLPSTGYDVYAWAEIIDHVDRLMIMAYDYSWNTPGPIGPLGWAEQVVQRAIADVGIENSHKVWLGSPQHGRNWIQRTASGTVTVGSCPSGWAPDPANVRINVPSPAAALAIAEREKVAPTWHADSGEWSFEYTWLSSGTVDGKSVDCKVKRELWFTDTRSALKRAALVPQYGIGGISIWNLGILQPDFYPRLVEYGREIAPAETTLTVKASSAVTYGRNAKITVSTSSDKGPARGAKATLLWSQTADGAVTAADAQAQKIESIILDGDGAGTFRTPVEQTGYFWVEVDATDATSAAAAEPQRTKVRWKVVPDSRQPTTIAGQSFTLAGSIAPQAEGVTIRVQKRSGDRWRTFSKVTTDATGRFTADVLVAKPKTMTYRYVAGNADGYVRGISAKVTLIVTAG